MPARSAACLLTERGEPTALAHTIYTESDCWILAFELGLKLNAPLLALVSVEDAHAWDHVVVDLGRETVLDVRGRASRDEITSRWSRTACTPLRLRELGRHHSFSNYLEALDGVRSSALVYDDDRATAQTVADALIALHLTPQETAA